MKNKYIATMLVVACIPLSGCDILNKVKKSKETGADVKREAVLPTDRVNIVQPVSSVYTSQDLESGIVKGDWSIERVNGKEAVGETAPFLKFDPANKMVYGNNGCNIINAGYQYNPADSTLTFSNMVSTMRACGMTGITDLEINAALGAAQYYSWRLSGNDYFLTLYDEEHQPVMEMMHQNFQFLNGTWAVVEIEGEAVNVPEMKLVIDVDEGKIHGNTGCNILNGTLETDMDAANSISFQKLATTRKACQEPNYETRLLVALEDASKAKPIDQEKVELIDSMGKIVLLLERTSDK